MRSPSTTTCRAAAAPTAAPGNPLLYEGLFPRWPDVAPEHVRPAVEALVGEAEAALAQLEVDVEGGAGVREVTDAMEKMGDRLGRAWGVVNHLKSTRDTEELRKAVEEMQPEVVRFGLKSAASRPVYLALKRIAHSGADVQDMSEAQRRIVESALREAELAGVDLKADDKKRFEEIQQRLSQLSTQFSNNVLDATKQFEIRLTQRDQVAGLPPSTLAMMAQAAAAKDDVEAATPEDGPWLVTLAPPVYIAIMQYADDRDLREKVYKAYLTRASEFSPDTSIDNAPIIKEILTLRKEKAALLGMTCHAEVSCASKMASPKTAMKLMEELRVASYDRAQAELQELLEFAAYSLGFQGFLRHWDMSYYAEKLRQQRYDFSEEELKAYFPLERVLDGLFALVERLFSVKIVPADSEDAPVWHPDVRFFRVQSLKGDTLAYFYLDPYARPEEKRAGAWMDEVAGRSRVLAPAGKDVRVPIAHMVCNGSPPVGDTPSLMTFREVETLFHEAGHMLQHVLTRQDEGLVAGIRGVEWDAVECPSQFMENWCYDKPTVDAMARHYKTGEKIPQELFDKVVKAKTFRAATAMLRQLHFAILDLELHSASFDPATMSVFDLDRKVAEKCTVLAPLETDRFLCGFSHIFAGGYSAGYFSYKWAEVLSADCFAAFEEAGLDNEEAVVETGARFAETILGRGGGQNPAKVFADFRGRPPSSEALLRHNGLLAQAS